MYAVMCHNEIKMFVQYQCLVEEKTGEDRKNSYFGLVGDDLWEIGAREDVVFDQVYGESIFMRKSERRRRINPMFNRICLVDMTIFRFY